MRDSAPTPPSIWAFGPTSPLTLVLAVLAVVGVVALTRRVWGRTGWPLRSVGVLLSQVLVVATVGLVVNQAEDIVTTWSAVVGQTSGISPKVTTQRPGALVADPGHPNLWAVSAAQKAADRQAAFKGSTTTVTVTGEKTGYALTAAVYLPGSYREATQKKRDYPVIELFAGYPGSYLSWVDGLRLAQMMNELIASGQMPAAIVISTSQNPNPPDDSQCVDATAQRGRPSLAETYLVQDVPGYLRSTYRVGDGRLNWIAAGYSTGGFCAANIGIQHADQYGGVISLSGNYTAVQDDTTGPLYADADSRRANSPLYTVGAAGRPPLVFALAATRDSPDDYDELTAFAPTVPKADALLVLVAPTGGHTPPVWRATARLSFAWVAQQLAEVG